MNDIIRSIILGIAQGVTEFLPISSSGHLVILGKIMKVEDGTVITAVLHAGTLVSVLFVFRREIIRIIKPFDWRTIRNIIISTFPAAVAGLTLSRFEMENELFSHTLVAGIGLLVTSAALFYLPRKEPQNKKMDDMGALDALIIGLAQCVAIIPGISRSGMTISTSLKIKFKRADAAIYSFLISIPVISGAAILEGVPYILEPPQTPGSTGIMALGIGFLVSAFVGYAALNTILESVRKGTLKKYAYYCLALGIVITALAVAGFLA